MTDNNQVPLSGTNSAPGAQPTPTQPAATPAPTPPPAAERADSESKHERSQREMRYRLETREAQLVAREAQRQFEEAAKLLQDLKTELESERKKRADAEATAQKVQADAQRATLIGEIATQYGLTPNVAKRLQGTTKEELEADAKALAAELKLARSNGQTPAGLIGEQAQASRAKQLVDMATNQYNADWLPRNNDKDNG